MRSALAAEFQAPDLSEMEDRPHIDRKDLKAFDSDVQDMLTLLVNRFGIKYRSANGAILLFPPDTSKSPFRISSKRSGKTQCRYLEKFAHDNLSKEAKEEIRLPVSEKEIHKLAEKLNGAEHEVEEQWTSVLGFGENKYVGFEVNDEGVFRCIRCRKEGKEYLTDTRRTFGSHNRYKHPVESAKKSIALKPDSRTTEIDAIPVAPPEKVTVQDFNLLDDLPIMQERPVQQAIDLLLIATGRGEEYVVKLRERNEQLERELDSMKERVETAEATVALMQEHIREALTL